MTGQTFTLAHANRIAPGQGEDLGGALAQAATERLERHKANPEAKVMYWADTVAQMLYLAAEAYEAGASASIGHNRADRYTSAARGHRQTADALLAEAKTQSDTIADARYFAAFVAGYNGEADANKYSFDNREAYQLGEYFKARGKPMPEAVHGNRDKARTAFIVEGTEYRVMYPSGKINEPEVEARENINALVDADIEAAKQRGGHYLD